MDTAQDYDSKRRKDPRRIAYMRAYLKDYNFKNREKHRDAARIRYQSDKAKFIEKARLWEKANPEKRKASIRRNVVKNTARTKRWVAANKERHEASKKKYYDSHYNDFLFRNHVRRALVRNATINLAGIKAWMKSVKSKPTCVCYYCRSVIKTSELHWEHIVPLAKGGSHSVENLCVSCASCNFKKSTKSVQAFIVTGQQILSL
jgi:5-methylcytosine-specific restriction endonuclease McrA